MTEHKNAGAPNNAQPTQAAAFRPAPSCLYLPAPAMVLRPVDIPQLKPALLAEYVQSRLSRWYPAGTADIAWELLHTGPNSCLVIVKQPQLDALRTNQAAGAFVSINCGWRIVADDFLRLVLTDTVCEAALFLDGQWTLLEPFACSGPEDIGTWLRYFSAASAPDAAVTTAGADVPDTVRSKALDLQLLLPPERKAEFASYFKTGNRYTSALFNSASGYSPIIVSTVHVQSFADALLPPRSGTRLFMPKNGSISRRYWLLAAGLAFLILNGSFLALRFSADRDTALYVRALQAADQVLRENRSIDQELIRLEALLPEYRIGVAHPGILLQHLADSGVRLTISSLSYDNGRFVLRGATSNAITLTEYLRSLSGFSGLSLSGVQLMANGDEQFSLSGDYND